MSSIPLPRYQSHKVVCALHIAAVEIHEDGSATIAPKEEGFPPFKTREGWGERFGGDDNDPGVFVQYEDGFSSWSPTKPFNEGYQPLAAATPGVAGPSSETGLTFGTAISSMQDGKAVARTGWNGKGMFLFLVDGGQVDHPIFCGPVEMHPYIAMKTATGDVVPWLASQTDMLANDWRLVGART